MIQLIAAFFCSLLFFCGAIYPSAPVFAVLTSCLLTMTMAVIYGRFETLARAAGEGEYGVEKETWTSADLARFLRTNDRLVEDEELRVYVATDMSGIVPLDSITVARFDGVRALIIGGKVHDSEKPATR